jgi:exosortase
LDIVRRLIPRVWLACFVLTASFLWLYRNVITGLVFDWVHDPNYSHGFLIIPIAAFFAWERRPSLARLPYRPSLAGLAFLLASLAMLVLGILGAELFLTRLSIIGTLAGIVLYLFGRAHLKAVLFPLAFLLLMIPLPSIVFNQIAFPLQLLASRVGEVSLSAAGIPVLREGNIIVLPHTSLEVAEACSGIRSLMTLLALGIVYGYFTDRRASIRTLIALMTIPVAVLANGVRVAGTGLLAYYFGPGAAEGFFHVFSGWLVFVAAFTMLFLVSRLLVYAIPPRHIVNQTPALVA